MDRVTKGDARAVFEAFGGGGWMIRLNAGTMEGAPADFMADGIARTSPMTAYNGKHYCALDWHVISVAIVEGNTPGESLNNSVFRDRIAARRVEFTLDGAPLETERTSTRRIHNPEFRGFTEAFYAQEGRIMAPQDLSVGMHTLKAIGDKVGSPLITIGSITFVVDAPGTGRCVA